MEENGLVNPTPNQEGFHYTLWALQEDFHGILSS